ncbi:MAG: DUF481 domain-containing protein [Planctomycetota bacterium]
MEFRAGLIGVLLLVGTAWAQPTGVEPPEPGTDGFDWMQYKNGEWLKGELRDLQDDDMEFESDEFATHSLDFDDVHRYVSGGDNTVGLIDGSSVTGRVRIEGDVVRVVTSDGIETFRRDQVRSIVTGRKARGAFWSGKLSFGTDFVRGNVDQTDISTYARLERRTIGSRLSFEFNSAFAEVGGTTTEDNQRLLTRFDVYRTERLFFRVPELELYRDQFQNIDLRATPTISAGYTLADNGDLEWSVTSGVGYRYTRFRDVEPGASREDSQFVAIFGTDAEWEATSRIDLGVSFSLTMPVPDADEYTFRATTYAEVDLWKDFDLDVRLTWDRVNAPASESDGALPEEDEFRLYIGIGYEF